MISYIFFVNCLPCEKITVQVSNLYCLTLESNRFLNGNTIISQNNIKEARNCYFKNLDYLTEKYEGYFVSETSHDNLYYINHLFLSKEDVQMPNFFIPQFYIKRRLGENNILKIDVPKILFQCINTEDFSCSFRPKPNNYYKWCRNKAKEILNNILVDQTIFLHRCSEIIKEIITEKDGLFFTSLEQEDYVLLFFKDDYIKICHFFASLISLITNKNCELNSDIFLFLYEYVEEFSDQKWEEHLDSLNIDSEEKYEFLLYCLLTDISNLLEFIDNLSYKFKIVEFSNCKDVIIGYPTFTIKIDTTKLDLKNITKVLVTDCKGVRVKYKKIISYKTKKILLFIDEIELKVNGIKTVDVKILTKNINYKAKKIKVY